MHKFEQQEIFKQKQDTVFKEALYFSKTMRRELRDVIVVAVLGIISTHCNDFIIFLSLFNKTKKHGP